MICAADDCNTEFAADKFNPRQRFCSRRCGRRVWMRQRRDTDPVFRAEQNRYARDHFANLTGIEYARRQLQVRRNMASLRRRRRSLGTSGSEGHKEA